MKKTKKSSKKQASSSTAEKRPAKRKKIVSLAEYEADAKGAAQAGDVGPGLTKSDKLTNAQAKAPKRAKGKGGGAPRGPSGLDAAAQVLGEAGEPLSAGEMVKRMLEKGLWKTSGRTRASTIYSALLRHIQKNGAGSRFRKVARGRFELVNYWLSQK
jgi:hypothetical protein